MRKKRSKRGSFTVGEKIFGVILAIIVLFPFYWIAISSFKTTDTITQPDLWPLKSTLTHYKQLLSTPAFMSGLRSSIIVAVGTIVVLLIIVILASYGLYRFEFKGKAFFNKLILLAYVFPGILLAVPVYSLMAKIQLIDSYWALIIMNVTFAAPFCVWLMNGFFAAVPKTLDEAAALDGLGKMGILFRIHIPLIKPGIATIAVYGLISSWTEFTFASILTISDEYKTLPIVLRAITSSYTVQWGQITASATLAMLPVIVMFAFAGKYFIGGLTAGAVKE